MADGTHNTLYTDNAFKSSLHDDNVFSSCLFGDNFFRSFIDKYGTDLAVLYSAYDFGNLRGLVDGVLNPAQKWRRDSDDAEQAFTGKEITGSDVALDWVKSPVQSLIDGGYAYFNGTDSKAEVASTQTYSGDFAIQWSALVASADERILGNTGGSSIRQNSPTAFVINTQATTNIVLTLIAVEYPYGIPYTAKFKRVSGSFGIYDASDTLISNEVADASDFQFQRIGGGRSSWGEGVFYNVYIDINNNGTNDHHWVGDSYLSSGWTDQIGSANCTVYGNLVDYTGQIAANAYLVPDYDQSGNDTDATPPADTNEPQVVLNGALTVDANSNIVSVYDGTDDYSVLASPVAFTGDFCVIAVVQLGSVAGHLNIMAHNSGTGALGINSATAVYAENDAGTSITTALSSVTLDTSTVYLMTFQRVSGVFKLFIDGVEEVSTALAGTITLNTVSDAAANQLNADKACLMGWTVSQAADRAAIEAGISKVVTTALS